jgi:enoyl-CoA hydratase
MNESNEAWYGTDFAVAHEQLAWERFVHLRQYFWGLWTLFWELPQITIAQVQGHAIEVGQELAMLCDLCVAADDAQFVLEPVFAVGGKFTNLWPLLMGIKKSKEVMLTGGSLTGKQAAELGLVNRVVSQDRLDAEVGALAGEIAQLPIEFIHFNKLSINKFFEAMGVRGAIESSINTHVMGTMFDTSQELRRRVQEQGWRARDKFLEQDVRRQPQ